MANSASMQSIAAKSMEIWAHQAKLMREAATKHAERMRGEATQHMHGAVAEGQRLAEAFAGSGGTLGQAWAEYVQDSAQRTMIALDILRKRGDQFLKHEADGAPPVLIYDYEVIVDGATLPRPSNYMLLKILPPEGVEIHEWKRPYVIIDPRAGHGAGIGGFKPDSQVGVALSDGHPVYFVAFRPHPEPDQILADVTHSEAAFLREIRRRHPKSPKPIVVGNCQGGWATAILAATNPDLTGPIVLNGAPMAYWSGRVGQDPMRYVGGMVGGVAPALLMSDIGGGVFDGAHLVLNFETLNPGRTWFRKYYDLYAEADDTEERFLEFEKWWGGFFLMNEAEIRWIVENLFVGNRLARNEARMETGRPIDPKLIRAPIIVFASHGDNITPPQQALNWIVDTYADETEIQIRGQRILYMVHDQVGHLGIFVSSSVAKREHAQMASTLKTIEALPPGLYEMKIEDVAGEGKQKHFTVSFHRRKTSDILSIDDARHEEPAFAAVARMSESIAEVYDVTARPLVRSMVTPDMAELGRTLHPMRFQRSMFASNNPLMGNVAEMAEAAKADRKKVSPDNPFLAAEKLMASMMEQGWNMVRDMRAMATEMAFLSMYANPLAVWYGESRAHARARKDASELRALPEVLGAMDRIDEGGFPEAVVRMLVALASTRGDVRRDRLERSSEVLTSREPFVSMDSAERARIIHEQTLIVHFEPDAALAALPKMIQNPADRAAAMEMVGYIVGNPEEMEPATVERIAKMRQLLEL